MFFIVPCPLQRNAQCVTNEMCAATDDPHKATDDTRMKTDDTHKATEDRLCAPLLL